MFNELLLQLLHIKALDIKSDSSSRSHHIICKTYLDLLFVCKICTFSPREPTKRLTFYISRRSQALTGSPFSFKIFGPRKGLLHQLEYLRLKKRSWTFFTGICGLQSPTIPGEHNKYHGYTVRGTPVLLEETSHNNHNKKKKHSFEPLGFIYGLDSILPLAFRKKSSQLILTVI